MSKELKRFTFNKEALASVLKGAGIAALGAVLTYLTQWAGSVDFGDLTPLVVALTSIIINITRKWVEKK